MKTTVMVIATLCVLVLTGSLVAQSTQPTSDKFSWHGELVALDENARLVTVKSPVVGEQALAEFGRLKAGERVMLTWSGFDLYADAIYRAVRMTGATKAEERFTFPVEFVSFDSARKYATFKVEIPGTSIANLKSLKPGEWVTATSPHGPSSKTTPIVMMRPYAGSASTSNTN
jgi:hypothetical protein